MRSVKNNKQETIIYRTNQALRFKISLVLDWVGIILAVLAFYYYLHPLFIVASGGLITMGCFIQLRIKCPKCGTFWYWQALKLPLGDNQIEKIYSQKNCPICKFSGSDDEHEESESKL